ncbi:MAG: DUF6776 family protein [Pseudomonadales bacterium]
MAKVRGSKQHRMVIKHHHPKKQWVMALAALACAVIVWGVGFLFGQYFERQAQLLRPDGQQMLLQLHEQVTELKQGRLVDKVAVDGARSDLKEKQTKIRQLEKDLAFYKGVLAPEKNVKGLQVDRLGVEKLSTARNFKFKWVLTQVGKNSKYLSGNTSLELVGKLAGVEKVLSLKDVVSEELNLKFKFRYFQNFSIQVELPEQFVAEKILLSATVAGNQAQSISQQYEWAVQEALVNVE